ncbi:MAG: GAF domain-containing protein [Methylococcales bacterium]|nr:MAG: GAF domain-containing protein [Methylococcales bacterium]
MTITNVDLSSCDREQVHLVGAIQPHGVLLVLAEPELRIVQASTNSADFLDVPCERLVGQCLDGLLGEENTAAIRTQLVKKELANATHLISVPFLSSQNGVVHISGNRINGLLLLEFELSAGTVEMIPAHAYSSRLQDMIQQLYGSAGLLSFLSVVVEQVRILTGFERVMIYRFDRDGSGMVIAEAKETNLEAYLGLHYPASDIPEPARRLFALSPLRHLPDVDYVPVPLFPDQSPLSDGSPVDLSHSFLRSVSVMYTSYLRNMGVKATLVMPLLKSDKLWGLISCMHHSEPKYLAYEQRFPVELLSRMISLRIGDLENLDHYAYRTQLIQAYCQLIGEMGRAKNYHDVLFGSKINLLNGINADGAALLENGKVTLLGITPTAYQVGLLAEWLAQQKDAVLVTHCLSYNFQAAGEFSAVASGLLAIRISRVNLTWVMWFRPEVLSETHWAGDPKKPVIIDDEDQESRLQPRTSFALWKETVRGYSEPWLDCEIEHVRKMRQSLHDILIEQTCQLIRLNTELELSNQALNNFVYAASHDLKEPLRGIHNYAELLRLEEGEHLSGQGHQRIETILCLTERMHHFLEALLEYSHLDYIEQDFQIYSITLLVEEIVDMLKKTNPNESITVDIQPAMPDILCNSTFVKVIFQNLIMNAIKYNAEAVKTIKIGCYTTNGMPVFFVQDNGIGISSEFHEYIFQPFKRLHGHKEYGGGSGVGLALTQKAITQHGGRIWIESGEGKGSTFCFTLTPEHVEEGGE